MSRFGDRKRIGVEQRRVTFRVTATEDHCGSVLEFVTILVRRADIHDTLRVRSEMIQAKTPTS